jgi:hypothetical protein
MVIFEIRPYAFKFVRGLKLHNDVIIFSKLKLHWILAIVDHIEGLLNKDQTELFDRLNNEPVNFDKKFLRQKSIPANRFEHYFSLILTDSHFINVDKVGNRMQNLRLISSQVDKSRLLFLSNNAFNITVALNLGYKTIPVTFSEDLATDTWQL